MKINRLILIARSILERELRAHNIDRVLEINRCLTELYRDRISELEKEEVKKKLLTKFKKAA